MAWFPLFTQLSGRRCLIAGGGRVAARKAEALAPFGPRIRVVAPDILPALERALVEPVWREVAGEDVAWAELVVDATGVPQVGEALYRQCVSRGIPINVVDRPELCTFIFPAILQKGPLVAGIATGGASPTAAAWARDQLEAAIPGEFDAILVQMQRQRELARERLDGQGRRAALLKRCFAMALERGRPLTEGELNRWWEGLV